MYNFSADIQHQPVMYDPVGQAKDKRDNYKLQQLHSTYYQDDQ